MMHTLKFSRVTGRPRVLIHEQDHERDSLDIEGAKKNARCRFMEGVIAGAPLWIVSESGHPRLHEMQWMTSEITGRIPKELHPDVRAFVSRHPAYRTWKVVADRYVSVHASGHIVGAYYADPLCGDKAPNAETLMIQHDVADERWSYDFKHREFVPPERPARKRVRSRFVSFHFPRAVA